MKNLKFKKTYFLVAGIILLLAVILLVVSCGKAASGDGVKFKSEYEKLNGEKASNGKEYQTLKIDKDNKVKYSTLEDIVDVLEEGTGIIYFGMPDCPWCRGIVPVLLDKIGCSCIDNLYYVDMSDARNTYEIVEDMPTETKKASDAYYKVLELLDKHLDNYKVTDSEGAQHVLPQKRVYLPLVVAVKNGRIVDAHTGSVELGDSQSPYDELTDVQKSELEVIFTNMIDKINEDEATCDEHC